MSLYTYKVVLADGKTKEGQRTAKTESAARLQLAKEMKIKAWVSISEKKPATGSLAGPIPTVTKLVMSVPKPEPSKLISNSKLGRMLYLQSGKCFFCGNSLREADASTEHLHAKSNGGKSTEDNEVVCCKALNQTFGNMDLKRKFEFVIKQAGNFKCPIP